MTCSDDSQQECASSVRKLGTDDLGQVSFAIVAVVLLIASAAAGTYLAARQMEEAKHERELRLLDDMEKAALDVSLELELLASARAHGIVSEWDEFPVNETRLSDCFVSSVASYIAESFPRSEGSFAVNVTNWTGGLFYLEKNTLDLVPSDVSDGGAIEVEGEDLESEALPTPSTEVLDERTATPYYAAVGNFTVVVDAKNAHIAKQSSFSKPVMSALAFLEAKLESFRTASSGGYSDLARLVGYMLSVLGQLRVLEGYGMPMYSDGKGSSDILTEQDLYRAVLVALLLEQVRLFRDVDESFEEDVVRACGGCPLGAKALHAVKARYLDPAELFLWFLGKTEPRLDPGMIIAQSIQSLGELLLVKYMDYFGWLGMLDIVDAGITFYTESLDSLISRLTGEDKAYSAVRAWIEESMRSSSVSRDSYALTFTNSCDFYVQVPQRTYFVEDVFGQQFPVWIGNATMPVRVQTYDIMSSPVWASFYEAYRECQDSLRGLFMDSVARLAFDLASMATVEVDGVVVDPADGVDLFTSIAGATGRVELLVDDAELEQAVRNLPFFSAQFELVQRFDEFAYSMVQEVFPTSLASGSVPGLAVELLENATYQYIPDLAVPVVQQLKEIVTHDLEHSPEWGVYSELCSRFMNASRTYMQRLVTWMNHSVVASDDSFTGPVVDTAVALLTVGIDQFPSIEHMAEDTLTALADDMLSQKALSAHKSSVYVDLVNPFSFWDGNLSSACEAGTVLNETLAVQVIGGLPKMTAVPYNPALGFSSLANMLPIDELMVQVQRPWEFDRSSQLYPNLHITEMGNATSVPYATQWNISVLGMLDVCVESSCSDLSAILNDASPSSETSVRIEFSIPIVLRSAWPLDGVAYNPTNTAFSDAIAAAKKFCDIVWDKLEPVFGWAKDGFERALRFVQDSFTTLASYATRVVKALSVGLQLMVTVLQEYIQRFLNSTIGKAIELFVDLTGRIEFRISLFGFTLTVQTSVPDLLFRNSLDIIRVFVHTDRFGPGLSFGIRVAKLSDGRFDIIANATISLRSATIEIVVDPLMQVLRRLVELHCKGNTWGLDIVIPEVQPYEIAEVSTADLPGIGAFLSNIPIPVLGLSASIKAGMRLKYSPPFPTDVVVNEFESNPPGEDSGKEWVELYNPLDEPRCVDGWMLSTVHGKSSVITLQGVVPARGLRVFSFPETSIDNGYSDDPFNDGDAIVLMDPTGKVVDLSPTLKDTENNGKTNQRAWDGGPRWVFEQGSMGDSNGVPVLLATADVIAKALFEAFKEAFMETKTVEVSASLAFLTMFGKRVLHHFIENLLSIVSEVIHEVVFYIQVMLADATGSASAGFRASFVVTGEAIVDLLRWLIHSFATFVVNLGRPSNPIAYPAFPQEFFSGLYLRFEVLFEVGPPRIIRSLGSDLGFSGTMTCVISIAPNLPAIGKLVGRSWGNWAVEFGVYLEGVPREMVSGVLARDTGDYVDLWLVKGKLYGI